MSNIYVTSIPFEDLKKGHRLQGVNDVLGTIAETEIGRDEHIGEEGDLQLVHIVWSEDQSVVKTYRYDVLAKVLVIGEPSEDLENIVLTSSDYDESYGTIDSDRFEIGTLLTIEGEILDINLNRDDGGYLSIMSHDVVIIAVIHPDAEDIDDDIFNYIDETIKVNLVVVDGHKLNVMSVDLT